MADATISLEDRQAIYDTLARYVWSMDTGDIEGGVATFTPDGVVTDVTGKRWDAAAGGVRGFATHFLMRPHRRGGQYHVQHLFVAPAEGGGYRVTSYWVSFQWDAESDRKCIRAMGSYRDTCVKVDGASRKRSLSGNAVAAYVKRTFQKTISSATARRHLHQLGFRRKRSRHRFTKANPEAQQAFAEAHIEPLQAPGSVTVCMDQG